MVNKDDIFKATGEDLKIVSISVDKPDRSWLKYKEQLLEFQAKYMSLIDTIAKLYTNLKKIHLFYAGPTPMAFIIGSYVNPTIHPLLILYNYFVKDSPKYTRAFEIN